jgi:dienelactone hydrolase
VDFDTEKVVAGLAMWFAKQGNLVVVPVRPGFGAAALSLPDEGVFSAYLGTVGKCSEANFRNPGLAVAAVDQWVIDYFIEQKLSASEGVVVVGESGGGWGAIALSSKNNKAISAIVTFAAGRGGRVDGKPNNNCAPDKLIDTAREFGQTARTPMLWIYIKNDTFFGPELSQRLFEAYTGAGGKAEYHLMPDFGQEGHSFFGSPETIPIWSPLVTRFLETHR